MTIVAEGGNATRVVFCREAAKNSCREAAANALVPFNTEFLFVCMFVCVTQLH